MIESSAPRVNLRDARVQYTEKNEPFPDPKCDAVAVLSWLHKGLEGNVDEYIRPEHIDHKQMFVVTALGIPKYDQRATLREKAVSCVARPHGARSSSGEIKRELSGSLGLLEVLVSIHTQRIPNSGEVSPVIYFSRDLVYRPSDSFENTGGMAI